MFQELEIIDDFILKKLSSPGGFTVPTETLEAWFAMIHDEGRKAKQKIASNALHLPDETHIEVFIQSYQRQLTDLADKLHGYLGFNEIIFNSPDNIPLTFQKIQKSTYQIIEDLIDYLRIYFGKFFLMDEKPTKRKILIAVLQFTENINDIQSLSENPNVYLDTIATALSDFINNPEKITYRKIDYLCKLVQEIQNFTHQDIETDLSIYVKYKAFNLNFNSVQFAITITSDYAKELEKLTSPNDKLDKLAWYLKRITQVPVQTKIIYDPNHNSLKEQVTHWILEEMCFLEKHFVLANIYNYEKDNGMSFSKFEFDMSVPQLAYFLKILVKCKVVRNVKDKELLRHFAKHTKTKGAENISPESLRVKFYDVEESTKDEVKSIIIRLLNFIQNNKNYIILFLNTSVIQLSCAINYISEF